MNIEQKVNEFIDDWKKQLDKELNELENELLEAEVRLEFAKYKAQVYRIAGRRLRLWGLNFRFLPMLIFYRGKTVT
jgi:hypothetical protein